MHAPTAEGIHNTRHAHCGERDSPNYCSPTAILPFSLNEIGFPNQNIVFPFSDVFGMA